MDFLRDSGYDSDSDLDNNDDDNNNETSNSVVSPPIKPKRNHDAATAAIHSEEVKPSIHDDDDDDDATTIRIKKARISKPNTEEVFERSVPHIKGNWAGHVFATPVPNSSNTIALIAASQRLVRTFRKLLEASAAAEDGQEYDTTFPIHVCSHVEQQDESDSPQQQPRSGGFLHISLSKLFFLQRPSIPSFERDLTLRLSCERSITLSFILPNTKKQPEILVNDEGTRSFLVVPAVMGSMGAIRLIQCVDDVLKKYRQPLYYEEPKIHMSVASMKGDIRPILEKYYEDRKEKLDCKESSDAVVEGGVRSAEEGSVSSCDDGSSSDSDDDDIITIRIDKVQCTFGTTKKFSVDLVK